MNTWWVFLGFWLLWIKQLWTFLYSFLMWTHALIFLWHISRGRIVRLKNRHIFNFIRNCQHISKVTVILYSHQQVYESCSCLASLWTLGIVSLLNFSYSGRETFMICLPETGGFLSWGFWAEEWSPHSSDSYGSGVLMSFCVCFNNKEL